MSVFADGQKQKLELAWIETENPLLMEPRLRLEFVNDPPLDDSPDRCLEATLSICDKPRCHCSNIRLKWHPSSPPTPGEPVGSTREFLYNLNNNAILRTPELEADPASLKLATSISAELSKLEQHKLREWFVAAKIDLIQSTPTDGIDISGLPSADAGEMIGFVEVFPFDFALAFSCNNETWAADEQSCVQPGCDCTETMLTFLNLADVAGKKTHIRNNSPSLRYDYDSETSKPATRRSSKSPPLPDLLAALKHQHADLNAQLKLRHGILQALYARHYQERAQARLQFQAQTPHQTGRNEPCPCGSGRKYKQCCLGKSNS